MSYEGFHIHAMCQNDFHLDESFWKFQTERKYVHLKVKIIHFRIHIVIRVFCQDPLSNK